MDAARAGSEPHCRRTVAERLAGGACGRWRQEGAAIGRRLHGMRGARVSADTSVPKQREAGLDEFESWLPDAVLRDAPAGVAFLGTDKRFVWVNPALARMYGRDESDFAGRPIAEMWPAADAARAQAALQQVLGEDRPATETYAAADAAPGQRVFH